MFGVMQDMPAPMIEAARAACAGMERVSFVQADLGTFVATSRSTSRSRACV
jgi:hypothetical protein